MTPVTMFTPNRNLFYCVVVKSPNQYPHKSV